MTEDATPKTPSITFNGTDYQAVLPDDFTIDEQMVLVHWTGMGPDALADFPGNHPGLIAALIEVSVARVELRVPQRQLRQMIGKLKTAELEGMLNDFGQEEDETETPPSAPAESSTSDENTTSSGADSSSTGAKPLAVVEANGSGSPGSAVSFTSPLATSEMASAQVAG